VVSAIQVEPGLANYGLILALLPDDRYRVNATRAEITLADLPTGETTLAWVGDWLARSPDGNWTVLENAGFSQLYEPLPHESPCGA